MKFKDFECIINKLEETDKKRREISSFFEKELTTSSFVYFNFGENLSSIIISMLSNYYSCWWTVDGKFDKNLSPYDGSCHISNDIEWWLYEDVNKIISFNDGREDVDVNDIKDFYNYLEKRRKNPFS